MKFNVILMRNPIDVVETANIGLRVSKCNATIQHGYSRDSAQLVSMNIKALRPDLFEQSEQMRR